MRRSSLPRRWRDITYEGYQQLVSSQPQTVSDAVGKIVTTHVWYLGVDLDNTQAQKFELGDRRSAGL